MTRKRSRLQRFRELRYKAVAAAAARSPELAELCEKMDRLKKAMTDEEKADLQREIDWIR